MTFHFSDVNILFFLIGVIFFLKITKNYPTDYTLNGVCDTPLHFKP